MFYPLRREKLLCFPLWAKREKHTGLEDCCLEARAIIWRWLSYMCRVRSKAVPALQVRNTEVEPRFEIGKKSVKLDALEISMKLGRFPREPSPQNENSCARNRCVENACPFWWCGSYVLPGLQYMQFYAPGVKSSFLFVGHTEKCQMLTGWSQNRQLLGAWCRILKAQLAKVDNPGTKPSGFAMFLPYTQTLETIYWPRHQTPNMKPEAVIRLFYRAP